MAKTYTSRSSKPSSFGSIVDIIVPFHGEYHQVTRLVESIFANTRTNYYNLILVDDASPNESFGRTLGMQAKQNAEARRIQNVLHCIRLENQKGFAGALNAGIQVSTSPYICCVNSDCIVEDPNWIRTMGESLLSFKDRNVRMVAPMTNNPCGGHPSQLGSKQDHSREFNVLEDGCLSLYCFMCHRQLFAHCGGLLKEYPYGCFEDEEFAARMKKHGFAQGVCNSWIYHEGEVTFQTLLKRDPKISKIIFEDNRKRCLEDMKKLQ